MSSILYINTNTQKKTQKDMAEFVYGIDFLDQHKIFK